MSKFTSEAWPGRWIVLPVLGACLVAVLGTRTGGVLLGFTEGAAAAIIAAWAISRPLKGLAAAVMRMSAGDRYGAIPKQPHGPLSELAKAVQALQASLAEADAKAVDQRRREAEARLHHAGRSFFTHQFHSTVDEVTKVFTAGRDEIGQTASQLSEESRLMHETMAGASEATAEASAEMHALSLSARDILTRISRSVGEMAESKQASEDAGGDIKRADEAVRSLARAANRIGEVVALIQTIARQTSLLALNASIEAVRSGEAGRGFAVVANDVKSLARQTAQATDDISNQIRGIQEAAEQTASALQQVAGSVSRIHAANDSLHDVLHAQTKELDQVAVHADSVAGRISAVLPGIDATVDQVDRASVQVIDTARELMGRSNTLVSTVGRYFANLDGGAIRIGILHSLSGTMMGSERPLQDLLVMLIEQCNASGGILGRPLEAVITDPHSDPDFYASQARTMIADHGVAAIFGCWTSASRKRVLPVVEELDSLLFYPSQYEGEEESPNIFYTGATPQQQAIPAVDYLLAQGKRRFFLLGTESIYARITNAVITAYLHSKSIKQNTLAQVYTPSDCRDWEETVAWIKRFGADGDAAVIMTVTGDANIHFFRELARQDVTAATMPVMSLSIGEREVAGLAGDALAGHLTAWNYLQAIDCPENRRFVHDWQSFMSDRNAMTDDPMEATWIGFHLWRAAVTKANSVETDAVKTALSGLRLRAPSGVEVFMDETNHHLHKPAFIGRVTDGARILPVWQSRGLLAPRPWSPWLIAGATENAFRQERADAPLRAAG